MRAMELPFGDIQEGGISTRSLKSVNGPVVQLFGLNSAHSDGGQAFTRR
jgi:hypothetical protein